MSLESLPNLLDYWEVRSLYGPIRGNEVDVELLSLALPDKKIFLQEVYATVEEFFSGSVAAKNKVSLINTALTFSIEKNFKKDPQTRQHLEEITFKIKKEEQSVSVP